MQALGEVTVLTRVQEALFNLESPTMGDCGDMEERDEGGDECSG